MLGPHLDSLARFVVRRRLYVLGAVLLLTLLMGMQIPRVQADFTPSDLFASLENQDQINADFYAAFGNTDNVILVLVEAEDVLTTPTLQYLHEMSLHFQREPYLERVESITVTPIPRPRRPGSQEAPQDSQGSAGGVVGNLTSLRQLLAAGTGEGDGSGPAAIWEDGGLPSLLPSLRVDPVIQGETVEPEEVSELRRALEDAPLLVGKLVGHDYRVAAAALVVSRNLTRNEDIGAAMEAITTYIDAHDPPPGATVRLAGLPYVRTEMVIKMRADQKILLPASLLVCLFMLLLSFRWLPGVLVPTAAVSMSATILVGGMVLVGETINILNNILPPLVLIIGISGSIHLVNRYGEEVRRDPRPGVAGQRAVRAMTVALFLTSFTTAVGFGSLLVSATPMLRRFGVTAALGVILAYVVSVTALPAGLSLARPPRRWREPGGDSPVDRFITKATGRILRWRWPVLGVSIVFFTMAAYAATGLQVNSSILDQIDEEDEIYQTTRLIEQSLEGMRPLEVSLTSDRDGRFDEPDVLNAISCVEDWALEQPGVLGANSYTDFLHEAWYRLTGEPSQRQAAFESPELVQLLGSMLEHGGDRNPIRAYVTPDRRRSRLNIQVEDMGAKATLALIENLRTELDQELGGLEGVDTALTGEAYLGSMGLTVVVNDLFTSLLAAVVLIFGFVALVLRSARLGLLSIPPNIIPLVGTMAYMAVRGIPLNLATVIIFSVSLGMAVDGTIHVFARFREEIATGHPVDDAMVRAARGTGKAILFTCLSLIFGFGVMFLSSFPPVRRFGELIAVTMGMCLAATAIMVPALLKLGWRGRVRIKEL